MMNLTLRGSRLNPELIIFATVGAIVVVLFLALGMLILQERTQQDALETQLEQVRRIASTPRQDLTELQREADRSLALLPTRLVDTEVYPFIRTVADRYNVWVLVQTATGVRATTLSGTAYDQMTFKLEAAGLYEDIRAFIDDLETQVEVSTLVVGKTNVQGGPGRRDTQLSMDYSIFLSRGDVASGS